MTESTLGMAGRVSFQVIPSIEEAPLRWRLRNKMRLSYIQGVAGEKVSKLVSKLLPITTATAKLRLVEILEDGSRIDYGIVSRKLVTQAGVDYMVQAFIADPAVTSSNTAEAPQRVGKFNYHALGEGTAPEDASDTALGSELSAGEYTAGERTLGNKSVGDVSNEYRTQATAQVAQAVAVTEHGILNLQAIGAGTLLDRSVFAVINLGANSFLQSTYDLTINPGS